MALENAIVVTAAEPSAPVVISTAPTSTDETTDASRRDATGRFVAADTSEGTPDGTPAPVSTPTGEPVADDANVDEDQQAAKRRSPDQRIGQAIGRQRHAERQAAEEREARLRAEAALEEYRRQTPSQGLSVAKPVATADATDETPTIEQFDTYDEYVQAFAKFHARNEARALFQQEQQRQQAAWEQDQHARMQQQILAAHQERVAKGKQAHADYDDVVMRTDIYVTPPMQDAILHSQAGGDLMYFLGQHPEEAARIAKLPPLPALVEMGRLQGRLEATSPTTVAGYAMPLSNTPPPVLPVRGGAHAASVPDDHLSLRDYVRKMNAKDEARRAR